MFGFYERMRCKTVKIATGSPQASGQAERVNRVLNATLNMLIDNDVGSQWY